MKGVIKGLIIGISIIIIGVTVLLIGLGLNGWVVKPSFDEASYSQQSESVEELKMDIGADSVKIEFYEGDKIEITYPVYRLIKTEITEKNGVLTYESHLRGTWIFGINLSKMPATVVKLPRNNVYNLDLEISAGAIKIEGGTYGKIDLNLSAGAVKFDGDVNCSSLKVDMSAGAFNAEGVITTSTEFEVSAGAVKIEELSCPVIEVDVSAGSVLLDVLGKESEYTVKVSRSAGSCNISNRTGTDGGKRIDVDISAGSVTFNFLDRS